MDLKSLLEVDLKESMRSNNEIKKRTLRMCLAAIRMAEIEKGGMLDEQAIITIIQKEVKGRNESIVDAQQANRPDLVEDNLAEIRILETYLPKQMQDDELQELIKTVIMEVGAASPSDMGKVIKAVLPRIQGRAPNDRVSLMVKQLLTK